MKKTLVKSAAVAAALAVAVVLASCASTPVGDPRLPVEEAHADEVDKVVVVDWTDRTLGEVSAPTWLKNMRRGNSDAFKEQWKETQNRVVKLSMASGKTEAIAQVLSRAGFAYTQAAELNQKVIGRVGQGLNDAGQLEALFVAASQTKADMTGLREETGFFQKVRTTNADADKKEAKQQAEEEKAYKAQMARLASENTQALLETASAKFKADEAEARQAAAEAELLSSYLQ